MSLDWQANEVPEALRTYKFTNDKGETESVMHPKMEALIWLTLKLRLNYTGNERKKAEVLKRLAYLREVDELPALWIGENTLKEHPEAWEGADKYGRYYLTAQDVLNYWGLWTNSNYSKGNTFLQWKAMVDRQN